MNPHEQYIHSIFAALFKGCAVVVEYLDSDETWFVVVSKPDRIIAGVIAHPAATFHYSMSITDDDQRYCFVEDDELLEPVILPILHDGGQPIWSNDDLGTVSTVPDVGQRMVDDRY